VESNGEFLNLWWNILWGKLRYDQATNLIIKGKSYSASCLHLSKWKPTHLTAFPSLSINKSDSFSTSH